LYISIALYGDPSGRTL